MSAKGDQQPNVSITTIEEKPAVEVVSGSASIQAECATTLVAQDGMNFRIDEDTKTAALVGVSTGAEGALDVPAKITSGGIEYAVTNICTLRGGVFANCRIWR